MQLPWSECKETHPTNNRWESSSSGIWGCMVVVLDSGWETVIPDGKNTTLFQPSTDSTRICFGFLYPLYNLYIQQV